MFIHFLKIFCYISYLLDYACVKSCFVLLTGLKPAYNDLGNQSIILSGTGA